MIIPYRPDASWRHPPIGTIAIGLANILVHFVWGRGDPEALKPFLLGFQGIDPVQWLTSAFLHADGWHLGGNLLFLYVFGAIVEDFLGGWFVPVYLLLAVASGALEQVLGILGHCEGLALGASSAIYGVIALAVLWAPRTRVTTFFWLYFSRPFTADVRVQWLAGGFMALQVAAVVLQGGRLSTEFLHACGIVVGLVVGLLCLKRRWVDTDGEDLLAPARPRVPAVARSTAPATAAGDEQLARLRTAVAGGDCRVALAAYDVLRREHPERMPELPVIERLVAICEGALEFHRATVVGERAVAAGLSSDCLRLQLARLHGQHLGDPEAGMVHLRAIRPESLTPEAQVEYERLRVRMARKRETVRYNRSPAAMGLLLGVVLLGILSGPAAAVDPDAGAGAGMQPDAEALPTSDAQPFGGDRPDAEAPSGDEDGSPAMGPVLPVVELHPVTGDLAVGDGATITLPEGLVYLPWNNVRMFLATTSPGGEEEAPIGLIMDEDQLDQLVDERGRAGSQEEWEARSMRFWQTGSAVEVHWEEGWIDSSAGLPTADDLMAGLELHAQIINRRHLMGPGITFSVDGWGRQPSFDAGRGALAWSIFATWRAQGAAAFAMPGASAELSQCCHLGAKGTVSFVCLGPPNDPVGPERIGLLSQQLQWEKGRGFARIQPDGVGERTGGLRRLILPRIVFGGAQNDPLVFRNGGLGFAWILVLVPLAIAIYVIFRRLRAIAGPARPAPGPGRCPACGSPVTPTATRCLSCGSSLVR